MTRKGGPNDVPRAQCIATFDNERTPRCEHAVDFQFAFLIEGLRMAPPNHPEGRGNPAFPAHRSHDRKALASLGGKPLPELRAAVHTGMAVEDYQATVQAWLASAKRPRLHRLYADRMYRPLQELLAYLRANRFQTFIVSARGLAYGVPPEPVIGTIVG